MLTLFVRKILYQSKAILGFVIFIKGGVKRLKSYMRDGFTLPASSVLHRGDTVYKGADLVVLIASHRRDSILVKLVDYYANNIVGLNYVLLVIVSDDDENPASLLSSTAKTNLVVLQTKNFPVGNKWQLGVDYARSLNPQSLMICGSDDFITPHYMLESVSILSEKKISIVGCSSWLVLDTKCGSETVFSVKYTGASMHQLLGSGRVYASDFLNECDWEIFETRFDRGLDYKGTSIASSMKSHIKICQKGNVVSVKGDWDMINPLSKMAASDFVQVSEYKAGLSSVEGGKEILVSCVS